MSYVILALDWNSGYSKSTGGFFNEIIEFGAVKLDDDLNIIEEFSLLIKPRITKKLRSNITELTSITNDDLKSGTSFVSAMSRFSMFSGDSIIMTWSVTDLMTLQSNCDHYYGTRTIPFLSRYADLQAYCQEMLFPEPKRSVSLGLLAAAGLLGIKTDDIKHHRAVGDSIIAARCLKRLYYPPVLSGFIQNADTPQFYGRLDFRNKILSDPDNPEIDRTAMTFNCYKCGAGAVRITPWEVKNKIFVSRQRCPLCKTEFRGRVKFKLTYDRLIPQKSIIIPKVIPVTPKQDGEEA